MFELNDLIHLPKEQCLDEDWGIILDKEERPLTSCSTSPKAGRWLYRIYWVSSGKKTNENEYWTHKHCELVARAK